MTELQKFMFEVSFDEETLAQQEAEALAAEQAAQEELLAPVEDIPTFTEDQVDAARDEGFQAGKEAGIREAADAIETKINDALGMIGANFEELFRRQTIDAADTFTDAVNIAVAIARKAFPHLNEAHGFPEIEHMVKDVLTEVLEEPRVIIHVNPELKAPLDERIAEIAKSSNFEGQVIILESEEIATGDCRVAWSSGSAERDVEGTLGKIGQIVAENLGSVKEEVVDSVETNGVDVPPMPMPDAPSPPEPEAAAEPAPESAAPESPESADEPAPDAVPAAAAPEPDTPPDEPPSEPEGPPPTPSAGLIADPSDAQETAENQYSEAADPAPDDADASAADDDTPSPPADPAADPDDMTAAHLQAGPGSMEPDPNESILEPDSEDGAATEADADEEADTDAPDDSTPPSVPNL